MIDERNSKGKKNTRKRQPYQEEKSGKSDWKDMKETPEKCVR
jgi:hypothetical protein